MITKDECVAQEIIEEIQNQEVRWGIQNHDVQRYGVILMEEAGEFCQAANDIYFCEASKKSLKESIKNARLELIQTAAVAISIVKMLDRNYKIEEEEDVIIPIKRQKE